MKAKIIGCFLFIICFSQAYGQFTFGVGYNIGAQKSQTEYEYILGVYNENETVDSYRVENALLPVRQGVHIRASGLKFNNPKKYVGGYSLEIGYGYFESESELFYLSSSTDNRDSIVNGYDGFTFKSRYHSVYFDHYFDFHYNPSENIKITNSFGVGLETIVKATSVNTGFDGTIVVADYPLLRLKYQPQITEKYDSCSLTFFASLNLFSVALFTKYKQPLFPDERIKYENIRVNSVGIRWLPLPKSLPESELKPH